jgi:cell division protein FtsW
MERPENALRWDYQLLLITLALAGSGLVMVLSASTFVAEKRYGDAYFFFKPQLAFMLLGVALMLILRNVPYRFFCRFSYVWLGLALLGLLLVFVPPVGRTVGGSTRWVRIGGFSGQPSEFAKFALVVFLAMSLAARREQLREFRRGLLPHLVVAGVLAGLIAVEPDLGSAVTVITIAAVLLFAAGARLWHLLLMAAAAAPAAVFFVLRHGYQLRRLATYLSPWEDSQGAGYHIIHSFYAFSLGGVTGVGPGAGRQKLFFLPEPHTDFIYSVVGEELGFVGVVAVALLFLMLVWRGVTIALESPEIEGTYLALGLTLIIGVQAFMNMFVVTGLLPTKGLALPFFSYGGSSLLMNFICVGILMNVAAQERRRGEDA